MKTTILKTSNGYALTGAYTDALGRGRKVEFWRIGQKRSQESL